MILPYDIGDELKIKEHQDQGYAAVGYAFCYCYMSIISHQSRPHQWPECPWSTLSYLETQPAICISGWRLNDVPSEIVYKNQTRVAIYAFYVRLFRIGIKEIRSEAGVVLLTGLSSVPLDYQYSSCRRPFHRPYRCPFRDTIPRNHQ